MHITEAHEYETLTEDTTTTYNGWKNYETWNVALWLSNDYPLYCVARDFGKWDQPFLKLRQELKQSSMQYEITGDSVSLWDPRLDIKALDEMLKEMNE